MTTRVATGARSAWLPVRLRFFDDDGDDVGDPVDVSLSGASREEAGQTVTFPERTFSRVSIEIRSGSIPTTAGHCRNRSERSANRPSSLRPARN